MLDWSWFFEYALKMDYKLNAEYYQGIEVNCWVCSNTATFSVNLECPREEAQNPFKAKLNALGSKVCMERDLIYKAVRLVGERT